MKKTLFILGAAALALVACNKSQTVETVEQNEIAFKSTIAPATKADPELTGANLPDSYSMLVSATSRDVNGTIETPKFFTGVSFNYNASHIWTASSTQYWPLGGSTLDFLAIAYPTAKASFITPTWNTTNSADEVVIASFNPVDIDVMYASKNAVKMADAEVGNTATAKAVPLSFKHAGAVIDVVIKSNLNGKVKINSVKFGNLTKEANVLSERKFTSLATSGTLTINNERNLISASWNYTQPTDQAYSDLFAFPTLSGEIATGATGIDVDNIIVVPQPKLNFLIDYQLGDGTPFTPSSDPMVVTYNDLKGNWLAGHKYTYTITLNFYEVEVKESVVEYISETDPSYTIE